MYSIIFCLYLCINSISNIIFYLLHLRSNSLFLWSLGCKDVSLLKLIYKFFWFLFTSVDLGDEVCSKHHALTIIVLYMHRADATIHVQLSICAVSRHLLLFAAAGETQSLAVVMSVDILLSYRASALARQQIGFSRKKLVIIFWS